MDEPNEGKDPAAQQEPSAPPASSGSGLDPKLAALLCYLFSIIGGIIFLVVDKDDKYVRFHAIQSIALGVVWAGAYIALSIFFGILTALPGFFFAAITLGSALYGLAGLAFFAVSVIMMIKAYQGEQYKLPVLGDFSEKQVG